MLMLFLLVMLTTNPAQSAGCAPGDPSVIAQDVHSPHFPATLALSATCLSTPSFTVQWVATDQTPNAGFTLDYGQSYRADGFHVRNDNNRNYKDRCFTARIRVLHLSTLNIFNICIMCLYRATEDFRIEYSEDNVDWTVAVEATMKGSIPPVDNCDDTAFYPATTDGGPPITFRYIRFTAISYYGGGAMLSFFRPRFYGKVDNRTKLVDLHVISSTILHLLYSTMFLSRL